MRIYNKIRWFVIFTLVAALAIALAIYYPRLTIISGYSSKNMASSVFVANRSPKFTAENGNNFSPINLAENKVNFNSKTASASVYGLNKRTAVYRDGLGAVLVVGDTEPTQLRPNRNQPIIAKPYPYGDMPQKDTIFPEINYQKLTQAIDSAFVNNTVQQTRAVLVLYKDHILTEKYASGYDKKSSFLGWSMTKSVLASLFGILQYQGKLDVNQKAGISLWKNDSRSNITLNNLLQMNSGLAWDEDYESISDVTKMLFLSRDMTVVQAEKKAVYEPDQHWNYSSGTTNLLSGVLRNQMFDSYQEYLDFPYQALIDRIGMYSFLLETDMNGNYVGSSYCWGTARDWGKFGLLYLHKGNWNGEQIFDKKWVNYVNMTAPNSKGRYGGHFWLNKKPTNYMPRAPKDCYSANGYQGQRVAIIPSKNLVVVRFGLAEEPNFKFDQFLGSVCEAVK